MTRMYKRQRRQLVFVVALGGLALINLLFFLTLYRPARTDYFQLEGSIESLRDSVRVQQAELARLEQIAEQLQTSDHDRQALYTTRFIGRDAGYARILPQLEQLAVQAGVEKSRVDYTESAIPDYGLYSVKIRLPVQGAYPAVVRFIQDLEQSDTFYIIDSIDVRTDNAGNAFQQSTGTVSLFLNMETFFYR